jgi:hypothetical protein
VDAEIIALETLKNPHLDLPTINNALENLNLSVQEKKSVLSSFVKGRTRLAEIAHHHHLIKDKFFSHSLKIVNARLTQTPLTIFEFLNLIEYLVSCDESQQKYLSNQLINSCFNAKQLDLLYDFKLIKGQRLRFNANRKSLQIGYFNFYEKHRSEIKSEENKLKLRLLQLHYSINSHYSFETISKLMSKINEPYSQSFSKTIPDFDQLFNGRNTLFELRFNKDQRLSLFKKISDHLKAQKGFSFMRISDGEAYGLTRDKSLSERQERHWWGETLDENIRNAIKSNFINSLNSGPDLLGIPTPYKFIHYLQYKTDLEINTQHDLETQVINRLAFVITQLEKMIIEGNFKKTCFCEDQANLLLFDKEAIKDLSKFAKRTVIISGYKEQVLRSNVAIENLIAIEIPTHQLMKFREDTVSSPKSLPWVYEEIRTWIKSNARPGDLFLVSAGFIGKSFITDAAEQGAVALDIGQKLLEVVNGD